MECGTCMRPPGSKVPLYCPSCARSMIYETRLQNAKILLDKERLASEITQINSSVKGVNTKPKAGDVKHDSLATRRWSIESNNMLRAQAKTQTSDILEHIEIVRDEIRTTRLEVAKRKASLNKKISERESIKALVTERRAANSDHVKREIKKISQSWDAVHNKAVETRSFLCRETAHLSGLRQWRKLRGGVVRDRYTVGGIQIFDLKDINSAKVNELTTSLCNTAHLVVLVSFYLSLRLPAEITLPHRNYPLPTIFAPANSYQGGEIPFPGTTPTPSLISSPVASRHIEQRPLPRPRPRPLFIEPGNLKDKIPHVAKRDPTAFAFFLEGISLLAWDVAWLCRSQGLYNGTESWEDVCNIGRNLWHLLVAPPRSPAILRLLSGRDMQQQGTGAGDTDPAGPSRPLKLGHFSQGSAHSSSSNNGTDFLRGWKMTKYTMIMDPLKRALLGEMSNAEWEMLEQDEWDDGGERFRDDQAVFIRHHHHDSADMDVAGRSSLDGANSIMTARTERRSDERDSQTDVGSRLELASANAPPASGRVKGTSGWMKLKNREK